MVGRTSEMLKEASVYTGISIRTIQRYYREAHNRPTAVNLLKLIEYFSWKFNREVKLNEILIEHKNGHNYTEISETAFRTQNRRNIKKQKI